MACSAGMIFSKARSPVMPNKTSASDRSVTRIRSVPSIRPGEPGGSEHRAAHPSIVHNATVSGPWSHLTSAGPAYGVLDDLDRAGGEVFSAAVLEIGRSMRTAAGGWPSSISSSWNQRPVRRLGSRPSGSSVWVSSASDRGQTLRAAHAQLRPSRPSRRRACFNLDDRRERTCDGSGRCRPREPRIFEDLPSPYSGHMSASPPNRPS